MTEPTPETDWTTARVVRDRDGRLWGRDATTFDSFARRWVRVGSDRESDGCYEESMARCYGPITPVLDADGLPVVTTVGDLTARHIGRLVRVDYGGGEAEVIIVERVKHYGFLDAQGMTLDDLVTRIEWRYLDESEG